MSGPRFVVLSFVSVLALAAACSRQTTTPTAPSASVVASADAAADGSTLTITEDGEVRNLFFRFMSRFIFGHTGTLEAFLKSLGKKVGEDVTPVVEVK